MNGRASIRCGGRGARCRGCFREGDPVPSLDGGANPRGENWTTGFDSRSHLMGEEDGSTVSPIARHNANRSSQMARQYADEDSGIDWFLKDGIATAKDYDVTRG